MLPALAISILFQSSLQAADYTSARRPGVQDAGLGNSPALKLALAAGMSALDHQTEREIGKKIWLVRGAEAIGYGFVIRHNIRVGRKK